MSAEKSEAIVIRQVDFSETSRVVTLFTRDFGKISALAKGARRLKGPFESALDLLARCQIVFLRKSSSGLDLLTEAKLLDRFQPGSRDLVGLYGGYYLAELLASLSEEYDPHPVWYDEAVRTLDRLEKGDNSRLAIVRFELATLREIGQLPSLDACIVCGTPAEGNTPFGFWVSQGGLICRNCRPAEYRHHAVQPGTLAILRRLAAESDAALDRLIVSPPQLQQMRQLMTTALSHILGHRPKMLRYLQSPGL
jgi:DNA repair protein RecO (recombination protein O)